VGTAPISAKYLFTRSHLTTSLQLVATVVNFDINSKTSSSKISPEKKRIYLQTFVRGDKMENKKGPPPSTWRDPLLLVSSCPYAIG
jgi:hypothetical protein